MRDFLEENESYQNLRLGIAADTLSMVDKITSVKVEGGEVFLNGYRVKSGYNLLCRIIHVSPSFLSKQEDMLATGIVNDNLDKTATYKLIGEPNDIRVVWPDDRTYVPREYVRQFLEDFSEEPWVGGLRLKHDGVARHYTDVFFFSEKSLVDDEDLRFGLSINFSELGQHTTDVFFGIYRVVCSNGLMVPLQGGAMASIAFKELNQDMPFKKYMEWVKEDAFEVPIKTFRKFYDRTKEVKKPNHEMVDDIQFGVRTHTIPKSVAQAASNKLLDAPNDVNTLWTTINMLTDSQHKLGVAQKKAEQTTYVWAEEILKKAGTQTLTA